MDRGHAAYAYTKDHRGRWRFRDALVAPAGYTSYGAAVLGDVALVQGVVDSQNVAFVFKRTFGQWSHTQTLPAARPSTFTNVALGNDYAAISDAGANGVAGAVYVYDKVGAGTYSLATELVPAGATEGWLSGYSIANDGDTILSSAPGESLVAAFVRSGGVWSEQAQLRHPGGFDTDVRASLSGDRALLASMTRSIEAPNNPVVFRRENGSWSVGTWTAKAQLSEPICGDENLFNTSEATIAGRTVFVTCPTAVTPHPAFDGRVFVYDIP